MINYVYMKSENCMEPRINSLVTHKDLHEYTPLYKNENIYVYLGEIPNMSGHCLVYDINTDKIIIDFHIFDMRELTDEEI